MAHDVERLIVLEQDTLSAPAAVPAPHSPLFGPLGLRAGWGIAFYLVLMGLLTFGLLAGLFRVTGQVRAYRVYQQQQRTAAAEAKAEHRRPVPAEMSVTMVSLAEASEVGGALLAAGGLALLERRRFRVYGLPLRRLRDIVPGALWGLLAIGLLVGLLRTAHLLVFDRRLLSGAAILRFGSVWLLAFLLVGVFEEFFFRGYVQFTLMRGLLGLGRQISPAHAQRAAFWTAALLLSGLFCAVHLSNAGEDPMGIAMVFVAGVLFSYALWKTGALWWGIGFHMTWDWGQSFLFGVPDSGTISAHRLFLTHPHGAPLLSGGMAGPEGSVLVMPVLLLVAVVLRSHRQAAQPPVQPVSLPGFANPGIGSRYLVESPQPHDLSR